MESRAPTAERLLSLSLAAFFCSLVKILHVLVFLLSTRLLRDLCCAYHQVFLA